MRWSIRSGWCDSPSISAVDFRMVDYNAYPGLLLPTPGEISEKLNAFFVENIRSLFDARRIVHMHSRLAMVTLPPESLRPYQRVCHSERFPDRRGIRCRRRCFICSRTRRWAARVFINRNCRLMKPASCSPTRRRCRMRSLHNGTKSSRDICANRIDTFHRIGGVEAKWNRLIFYDGGLLHSGDIAAPEKLSADPALGGSR